MADEDTVRMSARAVAVIVAGLAIGVGAAVAAEPDPAAGLRWTQLPPLPDGIGVAGPFVGSHLDAVIVAGGANFPVDAGGDRWSAAKVWHRDAWVLTAESGAEPAWSAAEPLPRSVGYGATASTRHGVVCIGGEDGTEVFREVVLLAWDARQRRLTMTPLPPLPTACAFAGAAAIDDVVYVACGQVGIDPGTVGSAFRRLDLGGFDAADARSVDRLAWESLPDVPGGPRGYPVVAAQHDGFTRCIFVMTGRRPLPGGGAGTIEPLRDVWRFDPAAYARGDTAAWRRRADMPRAMMAGGGLPLGQSHVLVLSGDDGELWSRTAELRDRHPGFRRTALAYHTITDTWIDAGATPANQVATPVAAWRDGGVLVSGEIRPRVRTTAAWAITPPAAAVTFGWLNAATLAAYLLITMAVGVASTLRTRTTDDFFRGGKRIPWWAAGLSIYATTLSSITYMALPAKAFSQDWVLALGNAMILVVAPVAVHVAMPFFRAIDATSAYEYLGRRFGMGFRLFGSGAFSLYHLFRMGIVMALAGLPLTSITPLAPRTSVALMGLACVAYCAFGGLEAVIWTDVFQAVVLVGGAVAILATIATGCGGRLWDGCLAAWDADKLRLANASLDPADVRLGLAIVLLGAIGQHLATYTSDQAVVQRYMTTPDRRQAARAIWTNALLAIPSTVLFFAIGTGLWVYYRVHPGQLEPGFTTDRILPLFIAREMPAGLAGLVVAGVFAAAQSTISTSINSVATAVVTDFLPAGRRTAAAGLRSARLATVAVGLGGTLLGLAFTDPRIMSLWDTFVGAIGLLMGTLGGLFCLGMLSRRASAGGAAIGVMASVSLLAWIATATTVQPYLYAVIGLVACAAVGWLASLPLPPPPPERVVGLTIGTLGRIPGAVAAAVLLACSATAGFASDRLDVGAVFTARDSLAPAPAADDDAGACLAGLVWDPGDFPVRVEPAGGDHGDVTLRFPSPRPGGDATNDMVAVEWYSASGTATGPQVACVVVHESGSGMSVGRMIARGLAARGVHAGMIHLPHYGLRRTKSAPPAAEALIRSVRQAVADVRRARDAIAALPAVDTGRIGVQGTSLGGFVAATAAGIDAGFSDAFILLAGGDIAGVLATGRRDAAGIREKLVASGMTPEEIGETVRAIEPLRLAGRLDRNRTWLYSAAHDDVVPPRHATLLAAAAGLDAEHHVELYADHYTGIVYLPVVLTQISRRLADGEPRRP